MEYQFYVLDVFTDKIFTGNQLAVFPSAEGLSTQTMQKIAKEFNYSESVFVTSVGKKEEEKNKGVLTRNVRIFTPAAELDFAGHPNIGAAMLLARINEVSDESKARIIFKEKAGDVPIQIHFKDSVPYSAELCPPKLPERGDDFSSIDIVAQVISLDVSDIDSLEKCVSFSCGVPYLFIPIKRLEKLEQATLNQEIWKKHFANFWAPQLYLFSKETVLPDSDFHARMFAPGLGVAEDSATGSAAAALAGYISHNYTENNGDDSSSTSESSFVIEQGFEMDRPSIINMSFSQKNQQVQHVKIKGNAVIFSKGKINL